VFHVVEFTTKLLDAAKSFKKLLQFGLRERSFAAQGPNLNADELVDLILNRMNHGWCTHRAYSSLHGARFA
jgi:hypothetical protein